MVPFYAVIDKKPLSNNLEDVDAFIQQAAGSGAFVMVGYVLRFQPLLSSVKALLESGAIGQVFTANIQAGQYLPDWRPDSDYRVGVSAQKALGGGCLLELSHELDYATWLFGPPDSLYSSSSLMSDLDLDVEDNAMIVFEYGSEAPCKRVVIQLDFLQRVPFLGIQVVGSEGTLKVDLISETAELFTQSDPKGRALGVPKMADGNEMYLRQFDFFFHRSLDGYDPSFQDTSADKDWADVSQAGYVMTLVETARQSGKLGAKISVKGL